MTENTSSDRFNQLQTILEDFYTGMTSGLASVMDTLAQGASVSALV